jgi:hypothetical protein
MCDGASSRPPGAAHRAAEWPMIDRMLIIALLSGLTARIMLLVIGAVVGHRVALEWHRWKINRSK